MKLTWILGVATAVLLHVFVLLFGGLFVPGAEKPRATITPVDLLDDVEDTKQKDKPLDGNDHAPEALGRFFAGHFGVGGRPLLGDARPGRTSTRSQPHRTQQPRGVRR